MDYIDQMSVVHDKGFQRRVQMATFEHAKTVNAGTPDTNDLAFIAGILNGETSAIQMAIGMFLTPAVVAAGINADGRSLATDAELLAAISNVWTNYAVAWVARTVSV